MLLTRDYFRVKDKHRLKMRKREKKYFIQMKMV